jgi:Helix-turn-helix domain
MYLSTNLTDLKPFATFDSQRLMDDTIYDYIEHLRANEEPQSVIDVLLFFGRSSLRVLGVSFAKYDTIAEAISKSKSTVIRAVKALKSYGMIDVIPTTRKWNSYGHSRKKSVNVVRVLSDGLSQQMTPQHDTAEATNEPNDNNESNVNMQPEPINNNHQQELLHNTSKEPLSTSPYVKFKQLIDNKKLRNKIYGVWLAHTSYIRNQYDESELLYIGIKAVMVTFKASKIRNKVGYYNGVLDRMLDRLYNVSMQAIATQ